MVCKATWPNGPGTVWGDRGHQHLWERWVSPGPCTPIHPPACCWVPATLGRSSDNPWQGLAHRRGGRRKEQPPTAASGSAPATLPRHSSPGTCVQGLSVPSRQTPTPAWPAGIVPARAGWPGLALGCRSSSTGDRLRTWPCTGTQRGHCCKDTFASSRRPAQLWDHLRWGGNKL